MSTIYYGFTRWKDRVSTEWYGVKMGRKAFRYRLDKFLSPDDLARVKEVIRSRDYVYSFTDIFSIVEPYMDKIEDTIFKLMKGELESTTNYTSIVEVTNLSDFK